MIQSWLLLLFRIVDVYCLLMFVYILMSWFPLNKAGWLVSLNKVLASICDPYLNLFKKLIPPIGGMLDITPLIALFVLQIGVNILSMLFF